MSIGETCVIQVTNIAPSASNEQMKQLFANLGNIKEIVVYPNEDSPIQPTSRVCYIRFAEPWSVGVAQHLTNTVFVDRALIVLPVNDGKIPDASTALSLTSAGPLSGGSNSGVVSQVVTGVGGAQVITTIDPRLTALGLPQYPPLPANMDPTKIEEIRRTVYVGNLDSTISAEQLLKFFNQIGEVKYVRMAGDESQPTRFTFVEFTDQSSVANALQYNGVIFGGRPLKINHSNNSIVKPLAKSSEVAQKEIEEAMKRVREAQSLISAAIEPGFLKFDKNSDKKSSRSRSRSRSRRRSTSRSRRRSRSRTRRSRSRERRRTRSRSRDKRRSRSPRRRSRSHERRRSRSRERRHRRRSRSRDKEKSSRRRSRSRDRDRDRVSKKKHSRSRSRSKSKRIDEKERLKDIEKSKEKSSSSSQLLELETKPEGPELPPESHKNQVLESNESLKLQTLRSRSIEKLRELSKSLSPSPPAIKAYSRRSRSPKRRSRSRGRGSDSPVKSERIHKKKRDKDRDRDRERSRSRDKYSKDKKKRRRDRDDSNERIKETKVKRDYDEEEKGYDSEERERSSLKMIRKMSVSPEQK